MPTPRTGALSLIELLIVVVILGILAGIGMASIQMVRRSAEAVQCLAGMRHIHSAILGYGADYRHFLPAGRFLGHNSYMSYDDLLVPYDGRGTLSQITGSDDKTSTNIIASGIDPEKLKLWNLYRCPSERLQQRTSAWDPSKMVRSYALNGAYDETVAAVPDRCRGVAWTGQNPDDGESPGAAARSWSIRTTAIASPSTTILLAEIRYLYGFMGGSLGETVSNPSRQGDARVTTEPLHNKSWNYLFADGHAERLRATDTVAAGKSTASNNAADMTDSMWWRR